MTAVDDVRRDFVQLWSQMAPFWGVPPTTARVYAWLLSQEESADAEAIQEGLAMSRGGVSQACRELQDWGLVVPERAPGERRVSWRAETDLETAIRNIVQARKRREWDPILARLRAWIPELKRERTKEARTFLERVEALEMLVATADDMADRFLRGGVVQKLGLKLLVANAKRASEKRKG